MNQARPLVSGTSQPSWALPYCKSPKLAFALLIISTIGGLVSVAIGVTALGTQLGWWSTHSLSHLGQSPIISLIAGGGGVTLISLIILLVKACSCPQKSLYGSRLESPSSTPFPPKAARILPAEKPPLTKEDFVPPPAPDLDPETQFRNGLKEWVDAAANQGAFVSSAIYNPRQIRSSFAASITKCYQEKSPSIHLGGVELDSFPHIIHQLTHLKIISLSNNSFYSLPPEIYQVTHLVSLSLEKSCIRLITPGISQLSHLKRLNLGQNKIETIPSEICQLVNLEYLGLMQNKITSISAKVSQLTNLKQLELGQNNITSIRAEVCQLVCLEVLFLGRNRITLFPADSFQLTRLKCLDLGDNTIAMIPPEIYQLTCLESLYLSHNAITSISPEICNLVSLKDLQLQNNRLTSLPNEVLELPRIQNLFIMSNPFSANVFSSIQQTVSHRDYHGPTIHISIFERRIDQEHSLEELLAELVIVAEQPPLRLQNLLLHEKHLKLWLSRLSAIGDYKNKRKELALLIYQSITEAEANVCFRDAFVGCIKGASKTCGDRMALSLLYMGVQYEIAQVVKTNNLAQLAYLLGHGTWALSELDTIAGNKARSLKFVDEIEVYLAYPVELKKALQLPIAIDTMLYFRCSSVTPNDLEQAKLLVSGFLSNLEAYCNFLAGDSIWQKALAGHKPIQHAQIVEKRDAAITNTGDYAAAGEQFKMDLAVLTHEVLHDVGLPPLIRDCQ